MCSYVSHLCSVQDAVLFLTTFISVIVARHDMAPFDIPPLVRKKDKNRKTNLVWGSLVEGPNPQSQEVMLPLKQDVSSPTFVIER